MSSWVDDISEDSNEKEAKKSRLREQVLEHSHRSQFNAVKWVGE
jgi:hypothetical protein